MTKKSGWHVEIDEENDTRRVIADAGVWEEFLDGSKQNKNLYTWFRRGTVFNYSLIEEIFIESSAIGEGALTNTKSRI